MAHPVPRPPRPRRPAARTAVVLAVVAVAAAAVAARGAPRHGRGPAVHAQTPVSGGPVYALPVVNFQGANDLCEAWIAVQNVGDRPAQPVVAYWTVGTGPIPAGRAVPAGAECAGLVRPGGHWNFYGAQVATGSRSGLVFSVDGASLAAAGADPALGADMAGSWLCERLYDETRLDVAAWRTFYQAWLSGTAWEGAVLGRLAGPPLAVRIHRNCPGLASPGVAVATAYDGPRVVTGDSGRFQATASLLPAGRRAGRRASGWLHVQNVGVQPGTFTARLQPADACAPGPVLDTATLEPGDAVAFDLGAAEAAESTSALVEGDRPFALVAIAARGDTATESAAGAPAADDGPRAGAPLAAVVPLSAGRHRITIAVANDGTEPASPRVTRFGPGGRSAAPVEPPAIVPALCAGGRASLVMTATVTTGVLEPQLLWIDSGAPFGARLAARVEVARLGDDGTVRGRFDVDARPVDDAVAWNAAPPLALPVALDDLSNSGVTTAIAVARTGAGAGTLRYAIDAYDHNGLTGRICGTLAGDAATVVDLTVHPTLPPGTKASAVVRAQGWDAAGAPGELVATALTAHGAAPGGEVPGDSWSATAAAPIVGPVRPSDEPAPCGPVAEPPPPPPPDVAALRAAVFVPVVGNVGQDSLCAPRLTVRNRGSEPAAVVVLRWGEPGFCDPDCAAPLEVHCLPLLAAGGRAITVESTTAFSAVVLSLRDRTLADLGVRPGDARTAAEVLCASDDLGGSCRGWRRFWQAWNDGERYADLPLGAVVGPPIEVEVERECLFGETPARTSTTFGAPDGAATRAGETRPDRFVYTVGDVALPGGATLGEPIVYLQNAGARCASVQLSFVARDGAVTRCDIAMLSAGESYPLNVTDCVDAGWRGTLVIAADAPLAIAVDRDDGGVTTSRANPGAVVPPTTTAGTAPGPSTTPSATAPSRPTAVPSAARLYLPRLFQRPPR